MSFQVCEYGLSFLQLLKIDEISAANLCEAFQIGCGAEIERELHNEVRPGRLVIEHKEIVVVSVGRNRFPAGVLEAVFQDQLGLVFWQSHCLAVRVGIAGRIGKLMSKLNPIRSLLDAPLP